MRIAGMTRSQQIEHFKIWRPFFAVKPRQTIEGDHVFLERIWRRITWQGITNGYCWEYSLDGLSK